MKGDAIQPLDQALRLAAMAKACAGMGRCVPPTSRRDPRHWAKHVLRVHRNRLPEDSAGDQSWSDADAGVRPVELLVIGGGTRAAQTVEVLAPSLRMATLENRK